MTWAQVLFMAQSFKTRTTKPKPNRIIFIFILHGLLEVLGKAQLKDHNKYALKTCRAQSLIQVPFKLVFLGPLFQAQNYLNKWPMDFFLKLNITNLALQSFLGQQIKPKLILKPWSIVHNLFCSFSQNISQSEFSTKERTKKTQLNSWLPK